MRECPHGYGTEAPPCPTCDAPTLADLFPEMVNERDELRATVQRVRDLAAKKLEQHGQCWNSIFGREILAALDGDES